MTQNDLYCRALASAERARLEGFLGTKSALLEIAQTLIEQGLVGTTSQVDATSDTLEEQN